jgi:serine/threonine protein phosphatase PrpC
MITAAGLSDIGCKRASNEDRILIDLEQGVFVIADGMGGERCGGRAAEIATSTLGECFHSSSKPCVDGEARMPDKLAESKSLMVQAIQLANRRVYRESVAMPECAGMGCTLSAIAVCGNAVTIGHVGDSRIYLYRNKELLQLTRDDSIVANLIAAGEITANEARSHPMRNKLTHSIGFAENVEAQLVSAVMFSGDRLLLSTDGLHGVIGDTGIVEVLEAAEPPAETASKLILAARAAGAPDNTSMIVVDYRETSP